VPRYQGKKLVAMAAKFPQSHNIGVNIGISFGCRHAAAKIVKRKRSVEMEGTPCHSFQIVGSLGCVVLGASSNQKNAAKKIRRGRKSVDEALGPF
jgi:hypothetical protein